MSVKAAPMPTPRTAGAFSAPGAVTSPGGLAQRGGYMEKRIDIKSRAPRAAKALKSSVGGKEQKLPAGMD